MGSDRALGPFGIDASWRIVISDSAASVERIAADELHAFLRTEGVEVEVVPQGEAPGARCIRLSSSGGGGDGFRLKRTGDGIVVTGGSPPAVLYGVCRLIDWLRGDREGDALDLAETGEAHR